jgi:hypothetical protein
MEKKATVIEGPLVIGGTRIVVIGSVRWGNTSLRDSGIYFGTKKPTHVLVISGSERKAFTIEGEEIVLEKLIKDVTGLSDYL